MKKNVYTWFKIFVLSYEVYIFLWKFSVLLKLKKKKN